MCLSFGLSYFELEVRQCQWETVQAEEINLHPVYPTIFLVIFSKSGFVDASIEVDFL